MFAGLKIKISSISRALTLVYILCIIPLLWIAWYNYPSADDFSMGFRAYSDFKASGGNVFAAVWGALYMSWYDYMNWMGYYTSTFFLSLPPSVFDERLYFLGTYILIGALSLSYVYLFRVIFVKILKCDRYLVNIVTMITLIISVECLPVGMARVEAFYWYCGAANYILMYSFAILYIGLLLSATVDSKRSKVIYDLVMAGVTGILAGGGNYMSSLCAAVFTVLFAIWVIIRRQKKYLLVPAVINLLAFALSCFAPGNNVRGEAVNGFGPLKTVFIAIYYVLDLCVDKWTTWAVLVLLAASVPFLWKMAEKCSLTFKYPVVVLFLGYMFVAANVAPPLYSLGNLEAGRLQALFFVQYILVLMLCMFYVLGWVQRAIGKSRGETNYLEGGLAGLFTVATVLFLVLAAINTKPVPNYFTTGAAVADIANGHAARFREQNLERRKALLDESEKDVVLDYYDYEPELLYYMDITTDPSDWTNNSMARYYGKDSVVRKDK